jgi:hypothetical protein
LKAYPSPSPVALTASLWVQASGEVVVLKEEDFLRLGADDVAKAWRELLSLTPREFDDVVSYCIPQPRDPAHKLG